ncbi:N-acetylglutamate synthase-like GNAT family acetyltransferase [Lysinibacillus parviboronicapiens]|uniref:N-acetylglutamate synthase-like GNAT family acetyltransferase n=1 Tax=Lysinibacillus parviboronicapiens TaxID=436516 RepID=A0ABV2PJD9_9BACI
MRNLEKIIQLDIDYIKSFSDMEKCAAGILFYNQEIPTYYDANHAHIWQKIEQVDCFLMDIKKFYVSKGLIPRMYLYNVEENQQCIEKLHVHGFQYETFTDDIQCWNGEFVQLPINPAIDIERVTDNNVQEALAVEMSISTFGEPALIKEAFYKTYQSPHFTYYLLRVNGVACCTADIFVAGNQGRVESVATIESFRGRGLIGYLLRHIQQQSMKAGIENLWIMPISAPVARVYAKLNFKSVGSVTSIHAFTEGKSIKELRQG